MIENKLAEGHRTLHLVPRFVWEAQKTSSSYLPEAFDADGFVHCTDGETKLMEAGNRYYQQDRRQYLVIEIDCDKLETPWRYDDPDRSFPHIYGAVAQKAVVRVGVVTRDDSGEFLRVRW